MADKVMQCGGPVLHLCCQQVQAAAQAAAVHASTSADNQLDPHSSSGVPPSLPSPLIAACSPCQASAGCRRQLRRQRQACCGPQRRRLLFLDDCRHAGCGGQLVLLQTGPPGGRAAQRQRPSRVLHRPVRQGGCSGSGVWDTQLMGARCCGEAPRNATGCLRPPSLATQGSPSRFKTKTMAHCRAGI